MQLYCSLYFCKFLAIYLFTEKILEHFQKYILFCKRQLFRWLNTLPGKQLHYFHFCLPFQLDAILFLFSFMSRPLLGDYVIQGSKDGVTNRVPLCKNGTNHGKAYLFACFHRYLETVKFVIQIYNFLKEDFKINASSIFIFINFDNVDEYASVSEKKSVLLYQESLSVGNDVTHRLP